MVWKKQKQLENIINEFKKYTKDNLNDTESTNTI